MHCRMNTDRLKLSHVLLMEYVRKSYEGECATGRINRPSYVGHPMALLDETRVNIPTVTKPTL
jgi:hypothetical protein